MTDKTLQRRLALLESGRGQKEVSLEIEGRTYVLTRQALLTLLKDIDGADCGLSPPVDP